MNIYRATDAPFPSTFLEYAQVFAGHAAVAVAVANITSHTNAVNEDTPCGKRWSPGQSSSRLANTRWWPPFCATTD
jgi:hypothetical protein